MNIDGIEMEGLMDTGMTVNLENQLLCCRRIQNGRLPLPMKVVGADGSEIPTGGRISGTFEIPGIKRINYLVLVQNISSHVTVGMDLLTICRCLIYTSNAELITVDGLLKDYQTTANE